MSGVLGGTPSGGSPGEPVLTRSSFYETANDGQGRIPEAVQPGRFAASPEELFRRADARWDPALKCFHPVQCWSAPGGGVSFSPVKGYTDRPMAVPCGRCIGCRLERGRQWAVRCMHEASMHEDNCFLTLTYSDAPAGLQPADLRDFWKRLRRSLGSQRISYFACGEYGETTRRPHYHACVFGYWPADARQHSGGANPLYRSAELERIWGHGHCPFGAVTFESAQYVAGYIAKKILGPEAEAYYKAELVDPDTGEITLQPIEPEFCRASRNPAVGLRWLEQYGDSDAWRHDSVVVRGSPSRLPKYYDRKLRPFATEKERSALRIKRIQQGNTPRARHENQPHRLEAQETVVLSKLKLKGRDAT